MLPYYVLLAVWLAVLVLFNYRMAKVMQFRATVVDLVHIRTSEDIERAAWSEDAATAHAILSQGLWRYGAFDAGPGFLKMVFSTKPLNIPTWYPERKFLEEANNG